MRPVAVILLLLACVPAAAFAVAAAAAPSASASAAAQPAAELLRRLWEELQAERFADALATARQGAAQELPNAGLWYNLAGLEEKHGDHNAAVAAFRRAVALGFDDFRHADEDADLGDLQRDPAYGVLRMQWAADLQAQALARAHTLVIGGWSAPIELSDRGRGGGSPEATLRLRPGPAGLEFELSIAGHEITTRTPWQGGSGVLVALTLPETPEAAEGSYHCEFAFGTSEAELPAGAIRLGSHWQRVAELTPKLRQDHATGRLRLTFAIPWSLCGNLHPAVDPALGLNVTYVRRGGVLAQGQAALLDDPAAGRPDRRWRRGVPLRWLWPASAAPVVHGRPGDLVLRRRELLFEPLAVVAATASPATVRLVLRDRHGTLHDQADLAVAGEAGLRRRHVALPVGLPSGSAQLGASYHDSAAGASAGWQTAILCLPHGWEATTAARLAALPDRERPSVRKHVDEALAELTARHERSDVTALGAVVDEIESLLERFATTGTTLPSGGPYLATMPARDGRPELRCSLYLPDRWRRGQEVRTLLLLVRMAGGHHHAVMRTPQLLADLAGAGGEITTRVALAIPHLPAAADPGGATAQVAGLIDWLRDFLACGPLHVAGVDLLAATALEAAAGKREDLAGILMLTGLNFAPYPPGDLAAQVARFSALDPSLPAGWYWFPGEEGPDDQAAALRGALRAAGLRLSPARPVAGGLDFGQAWQRSLHWVVQPSP